MAGTINKLIALLALSYYQCQCQCIEVKDEYYPRYHLAPPYGWMNDPNGFSKFRNEYHLFYQHNPYSSQQPGNVHWGHAKSKDLVHWEHLPIALFPDQWYDKNGVFSGSALVDNDTMYLYYTSNLDHPGQTPDHEQHQALATSTDGLHFKKYEQNPIIAGADLQPNIRDPKVWEHNNKFYMVLGHSINGTDGEALLFTSDDKIQWTQASTLLQSNGSLGFMFECPDFFELNGKFVLLFSPQGIKAEGDKYNNLYQTGYVVGDFDYATNVFTPLTEFKELDHGHDFYATQTIDDHGKRVMVAWMDMWDNVYPERADGFAGLMTVPRVLTLDRNLNIVQKPIRQRAHRHHALHQPGPPHAALELPDKTAEISIRAQKDSVVDVVIAQKEATDEDYTSVRIHFDPVNGTVTLDRRGADSIRRTQWRPEGRYLTWKILVDASSVELFCGSGEVTFSSRFFPRGKVTVSTDTSIRRHSSVRISPVQRTVPEPNSQQQCSAY
ncbi:hypothetical protein JYU34_009194 [Plutella xylostella]|uniref:Sucrose-6-phosphate hydrolase n=1 Tax=Plutella xylostella TaxID=51655 RepID=A0ABQ7QMK6_PLUXY|nr:hypothetical protein JYU34_009194 [Plutella xylostella]